MESKRKKKRQATRIVALVIASFGVFAPGVISAQLPAASPTRVGEIGLYGCPVHPGILATWPARCPMCQAVLSPMPSSALTRVSVRSEIRQGQLWRQRQRQNEQWREWGQRNEQQREQARRNAELREQARLNEQRGLPPPTYGYPPIQGYAYPFPYNYHYNPRAGRYEFLGPGPGYPYGGYQYNPNPGEQSYNPNADQYYYNPNKGHYFYDPHTGKFVYVNPRYTYPNR